MLEMVPIMFFFWGGGGGGTPEVWIKHEKWLQIIGTETYKTKVLFIAADEAHCVPKW